MQRPNFFLLMAACACALAALAHIGIIVGGPEWYRWFGAGEQMAQMAERGDAYPALVTAIIAAVLFAWAMYAWSAATDQFRMPLRRTALTLIAFIFLVRGSIGAWLMATSTSPYMQELQQRPVFIVVSSIICLLIGCCIVMGLRQRWHQLK